MYFMKNKKILVKATDHFFKQNGGKKFCVESQNKFPKRKQFSDVLTNMVFKTVRS